MELDIGELQAHKLNLQGARENLRKVRRELDKEGHELADGILEVENCLDFEIDDVIDNWLEDEMFDMAVDNAKLEKWKEWANK